MAKGYFLTQEEVDCIKEHCDFIQQSAETALEQFNSLDPDNIPKWVKSAMLYQRHVIGAMEFTRSQAVMRLQKDSADAK